MEKGESLSVVIVQPNINPYTEKYERSNNDIAILLGNLADVKMDSSVDFVIAPETVFAKNFRLGRIRTFSSHIYPKTIYSCLPKY